MTALWTNEQFSVPTTRGTNFEFMQWCDIPLADAWIEEAVKRFYGADGKLLDRLENAPYDQQRVATLSAWAALSGAYLAMNMPPYSEPLYLLAAKKWLGSLAQDDAQNSYKQRVGRSFQSTRRGEMAARLNSLWQKLFGADLGTGNGGEACAAWARVILGSDAQVIDWCTESPFIPGSCGPAGFNAGCANDWRNYVVNGKPTLDTIYPHCRPDAADVSYLERYSWRTLAWRKSSDTGAGRAAATFCAITEVSYPLLWYFIMGREITAALHDVGARVAIGRARLYVVAKNARTALDAGLLSTSELIDAAAKIPVSLERFGKDDPTTQQLTAAIGIAAIAVQASGPPQGPIAGAILAVVAALLQVLPIATGVNVDDWGRAQPVFLHGTITGDVTQEGMPIHEVPDAPSLMRPASSTSAVTPPAPASSSNTPMTPPAPTSSTTSKASAPTPMGAGAPIPGQPTVTTKTAGANATAAFDPIRAASTVFRTPPLAGLKTSLSGSIATHLSPLAPPPTATTGGTPPAVAPKVPFYKTPAGIIGIAVAAAVVLSAIAKPDPSRY